MQNNTINCEQDTRIKILQFTSFLLLIADPLFSLMCFVFNVQTTNFIRPEIFLLCATLGYGILAMLAANKPTRVLTATMSILTLFVLLIKFYAYNIIPEGVFMLSALIILIAKLYMFGVIVINNKSDKRLKKSIDVMFYIILVTSALGGFVPVIGSSVYNIICCILYVPSIIAIFYFVRSSAFSGYKSGAPVMLGAYEFWNKYFTIYIIVDVACFIILRLLQ